MSTKTIIESLSTITPLSDCHPVPVGATIPKGTPFWVAYDSGLTQWQPRGYDSDYTVGEVEHVYMTANKLEPSVHPTPEDSPIIVTDVTIPDCEPALGELAVFASSVDSWRAIGRDGHWYYLESKDITDWSHAVITKSGRGVWDENDKRDRVDAGSDGAVWRWVEDHCVWEESEPDCDDGTHESFGSLEAMRQVYGDGFLVGFAE